jgi:Leucine-rich repeat (LRR) protein
MESNQIKCVLKGTFIYLSNLRNLSLENNHIETIESDAFKGLYRLTYLNLTSNKIKALQTNNQTLFDLMKNLINLNLENNSIESIQLNDFGEINSLKYLYISSNRIKNIEAKSFKKLNLSELFLDNNQIDQIIDYSFDGLIHLHVLNLENNSIKFISSKGFYNSNMKKLVLSISNLSIENIKNLKNSLNPKKIRHYYCYNFYDSIYIENRIDLDCRKTYYLMKQKLFLNYFNEHIDSVRILNDSNCNTSQIQNYNSLFEIKTNISEDNYKMSTLFVVFMSVIILAFILYLFFIFYFR